MPIIPKIFKANISMSLDNGNIKDKKEISFGMYKSFLTERHTYIYIYMTILVSLAKTENHIPRYRKKYQYSITFTSIILGTIYSLPLKKRMLKGQPHTTTQSFHLCKSLLLPTPLKTPHTHALCHTPALTHSSIYKPLFDFLQ